MQAPQAILSPALTLPIAALLFAAVLVHLIYLVPRARPASRRRIRRANGFVMLAVIPAVTAGFSFLNHQTNTAAFLLTWVVAIGLIGFAVLLAMIDAANTLRLHHNARKRHLASLTASHAHGAATDDGA